MRIVRIVRNVEFSRLFDSFFIAAISTILITRFYLKISGYPEIGTDVLHISHLLPGAVLLVLAVLMMLGTVNRAVRNVSAITAGIGFGLVWDELGKFITNDNNYFFEGAPGLIYLTFVGLYLFARYIEQKRLTQDEYIANVIDLLKDAAIKDLDPREFEHAKELMAHVSPRHYLYESTQAMLLAVKPSPAREPMIINRLADKALYPLKIVSEWRFFANLVVAISVVYGLISVMAAVFFLYGAIIGEYIYGVFFPILVSDSTNWIGGVSALIAAGYVFWGIVVYLRGRVVKAYKLFEIALLVNLFIGQVALFFKEPNIAIFGLAVSLTLLISLKLLITEEALKHVRHHTPKAD